MPIIRRYEIEQRMRDKSGTLTRSDTQKRRAIRLARRQVATRRAVRADVYLRERTGLRVKRTLIYQARFDAKTGKVYGEEL